MAGLQMQGCLVRYDKKPSCVAFKSGSQNKHVILIGGLTDGFLSLSYAPPLADSLAPLGWSLVQAQLSSSYWGYGVGSLDQDAEEIHELVKHLISNFNSEAHILIGHSTGCQDSVRYVKNYAQTKQSQQFLKGVILQAPVSDREEMLQADEYVQLLPKAKQAVENNQGKEVIFRASDRVPISAKRLVSFLERKGDDDMFSSDFSDQELKEVLGHMSQFPSLVVQSGCEEYVPKSVNVGELGQRFALAMGSTQKCQIVDGANHALEGYENKFCEIVKKFITDLK